MLDWLKTILSDAYTDDIDKKVSAEISKGFVTKTDFNTLNETKKTLEKTVSDRDAQLDALKKLEPDKLQAEITRLQGENTATKQKFDEDLKTMKLDFALDARLLKEGAVNSKAVKSLLDVSKISLDGENLIGLDEQLKPLKEAEKWAFTPPSPAPPFVPPNPVPGEPTPNDGKDKPILDRVSDKMNQLFKV